MQAQIADGTQVQFPTSKVDSVAACGVVANNLEVAIAPKVGVGLLGHDFFGNYDIKIRDFSSHLYFARYIYKTNFYQILIAIEIRQ